MCPIEGTVNRQLILATMPEKPVHSYSLISAFVMCSGKFYK